MEIMLSFVLFISFILFMFIVFKPLNIFSKTTAELDATESKILKNISRDLSVVSMKIYPSVSESCFLVENPLNDSFPLIVKNESGKIVNASRSGKDIYFAKSGDFYTLYSSDELNEQGTPASCYALGEDDYKTGFVKTYKVVPYSELINFKENYNGNYNQLKKELGLKTDFYITVKNSAEIIFEAAKNKPMGIEIMAKDVPIFILNEDASLKFDLMNIQVWR